MIDVSNIRDALRKKEFMVVVNEIKRILINYQVVHKFYSTLII